MKFHTPSKGKLKRKNEPSSTHLTLEIIFRLITASGISDPSNQPLRGFETTRRVRMIYTPLISLPTPSAVRTSPQSSGLSLRGSVNSF